MAEIIPIKAWRYNPSLVTDIETLTSPLFDVVSARQRENLYQNPHNSIHLSVPRESKSEEILNKWKRRGIIQQDLIPGIYVYYQYFKLQGSQKEYCRKGFICNIKIYDWDEEVILRHENTMPKSVNDRTALLKKTELNVSATHGLYSDDSFSLEKYMDESMQTPLYEIEDYQGVREVLSVIHDAKIVEIFKQSIQEKQIILADGHHRYEGSLAYKKQQQNTNPNHTGNEGYNYHMMYLTNLESDDLRILATHRLIDQIAGFDEHKILEKLSEYFTIKPVENPYEVNEIIIGKQWAFGLLFKENAYKIRLKPDMISQISWNFPEVIKTLDLTVLHYFIIEKVLEIKGAEQTTSTHISFDRNFADCLNKVTKEEAQLAIITNEITMKEVKKVCFTGYTLPQKSTYFYPKTICGFLFSSIKEDEFSPNTDFSV